MNKERLEWVMSGLNQYALTQAEDHFLKTALGDFDKNHALTEGQEDRLESLYRQKSQLIPNKKSDRFPVRKSIPKKSSSRGLAQESFDVKRFKKQRFEQGWRERDRPNP